MLRLLALPVLALAAACVSATPPGSFLSSEPPGARVLIDGQDSGWVTPCHIALDTERVHSVSLELAGFAPYRIELKPSLRYHVVDWALGATGVQSTIHFPIFLPQPDFFAPFRYQRPLQPVRVFARLRPEAAP